MTILCFKSSTHEGIEDAFHAANGINPKNGGPFMTNWECEDGYHRCTTQNDENVFLLGRRLKDIGCEVTHSTREEEGRSVDCLKVWVPESRFF